MEGQHGAPKQHYQPPPPEQVLASLKAKLSTCKPDFKGHLPPPAKNKTQQSVERELAAERKKLAGDHPFVPYKRDKPLIALDGTRISKVLHHHHHEGDAENAHAAAVAARSELPADHHSRNKYRQQLDPATGKPVLASVLSWTGDEMPVNSAGHERRTGRRSFPEKLDVTNPLQTDDASRFKMRAVRQDVEDLTPRHKTALIRQITFANPKFTAESRVAHAREHWDPMSQLLAHAFVQPEERQKPARKDVLATSAAKKRNDVRLVAFMRRSQSARAWR